MSPKFEILNDLVFLPPRLSDGVIGNTSDFGSEESRFDP